VQESHAELVSRALGWDHSAFTALVRKWEKSTYSLAYRITGDHAEAEEVRQEVFLRLLEKPGTVKNPERFAGWIRRTTINTAINIVRRRGRFRRVAARLYTNTDTETDGSDQDLIRKEESRRLAQALGRLEPAERTLLTLRFDEELSFNEIATVTKRPASTVKSQFYKAVKNLRRILNSNKHKESSDE